MEPERRRARRAQPPGKGLYEYVDGGKRYLPGQWPDAAPDVFSTTGAVTIYETVPPSEQVPNYPSPAGSG